jgi:hypothetical protein
MVTALNGAPASVVCVVTAAEAACVDQVGRDLHVSDE